MKILIRSHEATWWQSENGKENVSVQLDLEAEFHFTHLIIYFQTFRPAAMLIERSYDFGKNWHVYRYFASNCAESFPGVLREPESVTDVVCDQRYSSVEPSKNGEVIFKVLPPHMNIENPYADHIQNMLKMTNLRINFTKLHSLGDTLLDDRSEIQEKYYYAISNMVVRGSCSCYGHASRCLPLEGYDTTNDMVHGRCECTHNTKGLNCEYCEDFFNDLPWKPALGKQTNACKKCDCNNHALSCHFDQAVYEHSGKVSGGVCDNCEHNTQGQHCEQCKPFFYRDPNESIQSPYACVPCDCDPIGSLDDGICDSVSDPETNSEPGACHCKKYVKGRRCDHCTEGYWNLTESNPEGCQECSCNLLGTVDNLGCNLYTGECTCKRNVMGRDCNQCMPETYGLSESKDGCTLCDCDPGGSYDNNCDVVTGKCKCRSHMQGRRCDEPNQNHFIPNLHIIYEGESSTCEGSSSFGNCTIVVREPYPDRVAGWTGPGFMKVYEGSDMIFTLDNIPKTMNYDVQLRYLPQIKGPWEDVRVSLLRPDNAEPGSDCYNANPLDENERRLRLDEYDSKVIALQDLCLEQGKVYKFIVSFHRQSPYEANPKSQILIDSVALIPRIEVTSIFDGSNKAETRLKDFQYYRCNDSYYEVNGINADKRCEELFSMAGTLIHDGATR
jgi:laminin, beta 1